MNLLTLNISTSSHQPFVLNEFPYEYPESQFAQLKKRDSSRSNRNIGQQFEGRKEQCQSHIASRSNIN